MPRPGFSQPCLLFDSMRSRVTPRPDVSGSRSMRRGFSLLESLLALAILAVGLAAISQHAFNAYQAGLRLQLETEGLLLAENAMLECIALERWQSESAPKTVPGFQAWQVECHCTPVNTQSPTGLLCLQVHAWKEGPHRHWSDTTLERLVRVPPQPNPAKASRP